MNKKKHVDSGNSLLHFANLVNKAKNDIAPKKTNLSIARNSQHREKVTHLVQALHQLPNDFPHANKDIKISRTNLALAISEGAIAFSATARPRKQKTFGLTHIINIFCDIMEPVINQCYPEYSQGYLSLRSAKLWPFREALMLNDSLKQKSERLQQIINEDNRRLTEAPYIDPCNQFWLETRDTIESLSLIVDTMTLISNCIPAVGADLRWCKLCFRRISISKTSKYCPLHAPEKKTNTKHKQGMRVANKVPPEIEAIKQRYQQLRNFLGDEPVFLNSDTTDMVDAILSGAQAAICNTHDLALYSQTLNDDWATIRSMWVNGIQMQFPHIYLTRSRLRIFQIAEILDLKVFSLVL